MTTFISKSLLKNNPTFLKIWLANLLSNFGTILYEIAIIWYIVETTNSALVAGGVALALLLGNAFGAMVIGQKIDKHQTRNIMMALGSLRLLIIISLFMIIIINVQNIAIYYIFSFIFSGINASYNVARAKSVPEVVIGVDEKNQQLQSFNEDGNTYNKELIDNEASKSTLLTEANALESVSASIVRIASWGLGGLIITLFDLPTALVITGIGLSLSLLLLLFSKWTSDTSDNDEAASTLGFIDGIRIIKKYANIKRIITAETLFFLLMGFLWVAFPIRVSEIGDGLLYGLHGVAFGIGYLITSLFLSFKARKKVQPLKIGQSYLIGLAVYALGNIILTFTFQPSIFLFGLFISGLGTTFWTTYQMTIFHTTIPTRQIGKIFSVFQFATTFIQVPGFLLGGLLVDALGTGLIMGTAVVLQIVPIGLIAVFFVMHPLMCYTVGEE